MNPSGGDSEYVQLLKTQASGGLNPVQQTRFNELQKQQQQTPQAATGQAPSFNDVVNNAKQLQQFTQQANQPAIQQLQGQQTDLSKRYSDLLDWIKGQGQVAVNSQTQATNAELARRGILPDSGLAQQQLAQSLLPVTAQNQGMLAQTGVQEPIQ